MRYRDRVFRINLQRPPQKAPSWDEDNPSASAWAVQDYCICHDIGHIWGFIKIILKVQQFWPEIASLFHFLASLPNEATIGSCQKFKFIWETQLTWQRQPSDQTIGVPQQWSGIPPLWKRFIRQLLDIFMLHTIQTWWKVKYIPQFLYQSLPWVLPPAPPSPFQPTTMN